MPKTGYVSYGGVDVILSRQGRAVVPVGADQVSDHYHPGSSRITRYDLGEAPASFTCEVVCDTKSAFDSFLGKRRTPQGFSGGDSHLNGSWSMTVAENSVTELGGRYYVQSTFVRL